MPTYSFIRESVEDRHHERGGEPRRAPRVFACPVCGQELADERTLAEHLGADHPLSPPRLLINGDGVIREKRLYRRPAPGDVVVANVTELLVSQNGGAYEQWSVTALAEALFEADSLVLDLVLRNVRAGDGFVTSEHLRIRVDVPMPESLDEADRSFQELLTHDVLDELTVDRFADEVSGLSSGAVYASALHDYAVGVLLKDQASGTADAMPFAAHREKFERALDVLRHFPERAAAKAICGFIRFGFNDFETATEPSGTPQLDRCMAALRALSTGAVPVVAPDESEEGGRCPTDVMTAFILEHWESPDAAAALVAWAKRGSITREDAAKCMALAVLAPYPKDPRRRPGSPAV